MKNLCFIDLDGVLADFVNGVFKFHNFSIPWTEVGWEFDKKSGLSPEVFWNSLGMNFWAGLQPTQEFSAIKDAAEKRFGKDNIFLCSSPCLVNGCTAGKGLWVDKHLPGYGRRLILSNRKEVFSGSGRVLIDDRDENIAEWIKLGGIGLLVPRPWNAARSTSTNVSDEVVKAIEQL